MATEDGKGESSKALTAGHARIELLTKLCVKERVRYLSLFQASPQLRLIGQQPDNLSSTDRPGNSTSLDTLAIKQEYREIAKRFN
jgi:hypothetical protein